MNRKLDKQRGAVLLETAYVLPIILGLSLFIIEVVGFALNSFAVNDVLSDIHTRMMSEVATVSSMQPGETLDPSVQYASCVNNEVTLPTGSNTSINTIITDTLSGNGVTVTNPSTNITKSTVSGFNVYVVKFTGVANSLVIPGFLSTMFLPLDVDTVVSIKESCES